MKRWTWHRGDELWYSDADLEAEASGSVIGVSIDSITSKDELTERQLHELLWISRQQFADEQLLCDLSKVTVPLMESLSKKGLVRWEEVKHPYSRSARILDVAPLPSVLRAPANEAT